MRKRETQKATLGDSARGNSQDMTTEPRSAGWEGARGFWGKGTPSTQVLRQERAWHVQGWEKSHCSVCTKVSLFLSSENVALETDYQVGRSLLDHLEVCPSVWGEETSPGQFCWLTVPGLTTVNQKARVFPIFIVLHNLLPLSWCMLITFSLDTARLDIKGLSLLTCPFGMKMGQNSNQLPH